MSSGLRLAFKKYHKKIAKKLIKKTSGQDSQMDLSTCVLGEGFCLKSVLFPFSFFESLHAPVFFFFGLEHLRRHSQVLGEGVLCLKSTLIEP